MQHVRSDQALLEWHQMVPSPLNDIDVVVTSTHVSAPIQSKMHYSQLEPTYDEVPKNIGRNCLIHYFIKMS
jgi:hypothetical protein